MHDLLRFSSLTIKVSKLKADCIVIILVITICEMPAMNYDILLSLCHINHVLRIQINSVHPYTVYRTTLCRSSHAPPLPTVVHHLPNQLFCPINWNRQSVVCCAFENQCRRSRPYVLLFCGVVLFVCLFLFMHVQNSSMSFSPARTRKDTWKEGESWGKTPPA